MAVSQTLASVVTETCEARRKRDVDSGHTECGAGTGAGSRDETERSLASIPVANRDDPGLETRGENVMLKSTVSSHVNCKCKCGIN